MKNELILKKAKIKKPCHYCFMRMMLNQHLKLKDLECFKDKTYD